jgi:hypothetical protein
MDLSLFHYCNSHRIAGGFLRSVVGNIILQVEVEVIRANGRIGDGKQFEFRHINYCT